MNIFLNILVPIICLILGYLFGSIPISIIIGKKKFHVDIRDYGSGNAGATNAGRLWGTKWRIIVTVLDVSKTILPMVMCWAFLSFVPFNGRPLMPLANSFYFDDISEYVIQWPAYYLAGIGVVIGHCWPIFAQFRGGKGAASFLGCAAVTSWMFGLLGFLGYEIWRKCTKMVSKSMLLNALIFVILDWIFTILFFTHVIPAELHWLPTYCPYYAVIPLWHPLMMTINYVIMAWRHKENIKRILNGTERTIQKNS